MVKKAIIIEDGREFTEKMPSVPPKYKSRPLSGSKEDVRRVKEDVAELEKKIGNMSSELSSISKEVDSKLDTVMEFLQSMNKRLNSPEDIELDETDEKEVNTGKKSKKK